jgi:hypothetical protein
LSEFAIIRVSFAAIRVEIICVKTIQRGRDASLKKDTESFFREWLDASQWRTP